MLTTLEKQKRQDIMSQFRRSELDTGSSEVQVALLTSRIKDLTEHFKIHKKDFHGRQGLLRLVNRRRRLLNYLRKNDIEKYKNIISQLKLRK